MRKTEGVPIRMHDNNIVLLSGYTDNMFKLLVSRPIVRKRDKKNVHFSVPPSWEIIQRCVNRKRYNILYNKIISKI